MAAFEIDTGDTPRTAIDFASDWLLDQCPGDYTDAQKVQAMAHHIIGHLSPDRGDNRRPKKLATIRDHFTANWRFLGCLATEHPGLFDECLTAYVERLQAD